MHYDYITLSRVAKTHLANTKVANTSCSNTDNLEKYIHDSFLMESDVDLSSMLEDLKDFEDWCCTTASDSNKFFVFFQDAILSAYFRFYCSKSKAWSKIRNFFLFICTAFLPVLAAFVLQLGTDTPKEILASTSMVTTGVIISIWVVTYVYSEWQKLTAYRETWARHSACYSRLRLALSKFLTSPRSNDDYKDFVVRTFAILEQNYDQFLTNLSSNGFVKNADSALNGVE